MFGLQKRVNELEEKVRKLEIALEDMKKKQSVENARVQCAPIKAKVDKLEKALYNMTKTSSAPVYDEEHEKKMSQQAESPIKNDEEHEKKMFQQAELQVRNKVETLKKDKSSSAYLPDDPKNFSYIDEPGTIPRVRVIREYPQKTDEDILAPYKNEGICITGYNGFDADRIVIPKKIDGKPLISIGESAFKNVSASEIILPDSIITIKEYAFYGCENLRHINLPKGLIYLGGCAFSSSGLTSITFPKFLKQIYPDCCSDCSKLSTVVFSSNLKRICENAFSYCRSITKISLPEGLTVLDKYCFQETGITTLIIPESVKYVSGQIFSYYRATEKVTCVFLGKETRIISDEVNIRSGYFNGVKLIYCLPESNVQKPAREHNIPIKPLSEFEEY